jgi:hypothetical protein
MKKGLFAILAFCFFTLAAIAQSTKKEDSSLVPTGRDWNEWDFTLKVGFITGFQVGFITGVGEAVGEVHKVGEPIKDSPVAKKVMDFWFPKAFFSRGEYISALNSFYADSSNLIIPIKGAYYYVTMKFRGATPHELEEFAAYLRKDANEANK